MAKARIPEACQSQDMAKILGITPRRLNQLALEGVLVPQSRGVFPIAENVKRFMEYRVSLAADSAAPSTQDRLNEQRLKSLQIKQAKEDGRLITVQEALNAFDEATGRFLQCLSGLPARITRDVAERRRIEKIIDAERERLARDFVEKAPTSKAVGGTS